MRELLSALEFLAVRHEAISDADKFMVIEGLLRTLAMDRGAAFGIRRFNADVWPLSAPGRPLLRPIHPVSNLVSRQHQYVRKRRRIPA